MPKSPTGLCALLTVSLLLGDTLAETTVQTCSQEQASAAASQVVGRSLIQFQRTQILYQDSGTRTYACKGCSSSNGVGSTAPLTEAGFISVRNECCTPEMASFIKRLIEASEPGRGVCAAGGLYGTAAFYDCTDDDEEFNFDMLKVAVGPGSRAAGGDCPWIGFPNKPNGCLARSANCPSFPGATVAPCGPQKTSTQPQTSSPTQPPTALCAEKDQGCLASKCCKDSRLICYEKDNYWAACKDSCTPGIDTVNDAPQYQTPWSCKPLSPIPTCAPTGTNCHTSLCCEDAGLFCYEKNNEYATCKASCTPGVDQYDPPQFRTPWSCNILGPTPPPTPPRA
eukprot:CAMPEP_0169107052 /NCGR_PEP_ID=MMETSP1015-20121227/24675_1 /TAXON_ID=342587 /ORGANISM="Karlodinium micrum, Strain CCMP2283" /LENGTH=338 /DNA_ID=CAMNT_0009168555 /DNA_START=25 /DNA_END=1041 /DNA_ORIENTATION=-